MKVFDGAKMRAIRKEAELTQYDLAPTVPAVSGRAIRQITQYHVD